MRTFKHSKYLLRQNTQIFKCKLTKQQNKKQKQKKNSDFKVLNIKI